MEGSFVLGKKGFTITSILLVVCVLYMSNVFGADFDAYQIGSTTLYIPVSNESLTVQIVNTNDTENITYVNITVPSGMEYITDSNVTTANDTDFSNSTDNITWSNTTDVGFIANGSSENFTFNVGVPTHTPGNYTFTITTIDTSGVENSTTLNYTVLHEFSIGTTEWAESHPQCGGICSSPDVNLTNATDRFFYHNQTMPIVVNFTGPNGGVPNLTVTGNFSQIGASGSISAEDLGNGLYRFNATVNYSALGSVNQMSTVDINISAWNGSEYWNTSAWSLLVNMSTFGCPPADEPGIQFPVVPGYNYTNGSQNVTPMQATGCTQNATLCQYMDEYGSGVWNGSEWLICAPQFGSETTNMSSVAETGNFSAIENFTVHVTGKAKIVFLQNVSFASREESQAIMEFALRNLMGAGKVGINDSEWNGTGGRPNLNLSAELTLYNITGSMGITDPSVGYGSYNGTDLPSDLQVCPPEICYGFSWNGENLTFTVTSFSSYVVGNTLYQLNFTNLTSMNTASSGENASFVVRITNNGNATQEQYNLSLNISGNGQGGLNTTFITLNQSESRDVLVNISSNVAGNVSSYIVAYHYNGTETETDINLSSADDGVILNVTFRPDLNASKIMWNSSQNNHPSSGSNITVNATVCNIGDLNLTDNITVWFLWDGSKKDNQSVPNTSLVNGTCAPVYFETINGSDVTNGLHTITVTADALDNITESNETNNDATQQIIVGYNVTILTMNGNATTITPTSNESILLNISVLFGNGDPVTDLTVSKFTVYDNFSGTIVRTWTHNSSLQGFTFNVSFVSTMNASGIYWFNITAYYDASTPRPRYHNLTVNVSNGSYSGSTGGNDRYFLLAPEVRVEFSVSSSTVNEGSNRTVTIKINNTGTADIENITVSIFDWGSYFNGPAGSSCSAYTTAPVTNTTSPRTICSPSIEARTVSSDVSSNVFATLKGNNSDGLYFDGINSIELTVNNLADDDGDGDGGGGGDGGDECSTNASCSSNQYCSSGSCVTLNCPSGYYIHDHMCYAHNYVKIKSFESTISVLQGDYYETLVSMKNDGRTAITGKLNVSLGPCSGTAEVSPSSCSLASLKACTFIVNMSISENAACRSYTGTFKAYDSANTSAFDEENFTLRVLPTNETKADINQTYTSYVPKVDELDAWFERLNATGMFNESVMADAKQFLNDLQETLSIIGVSIDNDDFVRASDLLLTMDEKINKTTEELNKLQLQGGGGAGVGLAGLDIWTIVIIAVIILIATGFLIYMLKPAPSAAYKIGKGFSVPKEGTFKKIIRKIKEFFSNILHRGGKASGTVQSSVKRSAKPQMLDFKESYERAEPEEPEFHGRLAGLKRLFHRVKKKREQTSVFQFLGRPVKPE